VRDEVGTHAVSRITYTHRVREAGERAGFAGSEKASNRQAQLVVQGCVELAASHAIGPSRGHQSRIVHRRGTGGSRSASLELSGLRRFLALLSQLHGVIQRTRSAAWRLHSGYIVRRAMTDRTSCRPIRGVLCVGYYGESQNDSLAEPARRSTRTLTFTLLLHRLAGSWQWGTQMEGPDT
jgi:hypothetical protein